MQPHAAWSWLGHSIVVLAEVDLLLQHDAVHTSLEQGEDETRLALELAQPVEDLGRGSAGHVVEDRGELCVGVVG